jgi:ATP-binding cassette subfamily B protein
MHYLKRLLPFLKPYRGSLVLLALWTIGGIACGMLQPYQLSLVVDEGIAKMDMAAVTRYCLMLIGLTALFSLFNYLQGVQHGTLGANVVRDLRNTLYQKLQRLPFSWYTTMPTGQIMSRMLNDLDSIEQFVSFGFVLMIREAVTLALTLAICLYLDWQLTLLVMIPAPFLLFSITRFRKRIDPAWEAIREQMGKLTSVVQENVAGVRVVKAFARERFAMQRFGNENDVNRQKNVNRAKLEADYFPSADFFSSLSFVILVLVGSFRLMDGTLSFGIFFSFTWYIWSLIWPMRELGFFTNIMRQAAASAPRLFAIADASEMPEGDRTVGQWVSGSVRDTDPLTHCLTAPSGRIEFDRVHFAFPDDPKTPVLNGVSFVIEPGQTVAILGGTGSGKSSVINLVPRFYDVTDGRVLVDGVDVRDLPLKDLRLRMSLVPQETFLFSASLKENVAFGKPDASLEDVVAASKVAQVDEFAQKLPKGYDTKVGERGVGLSGGQKQRVALARAVLMNPAILILDEATSAVDTATEAVIQDAMAQVMRGRTSLVVAQRLSTVRNADKIIVLADGRVVQEGSHEQLYAVAGPYRELYDLQFKDQETTHADELDEEMIGEAEQDHVPA